VVVRVLGVVDRLDEEGAVAVVDPVVALEGRAAAVEPVAPVGVVTAAPLDGADVVLVHEAEEGTPLVTDLLAEHAVERAERRVPRRFVGAARLEPVAPLAAPPHVHRDDAAEGAALLRAEPA